MRLQLNHARMEAPRVGRRSRERRAGARLAAAAALRVRMHGVQGGLQHTRTCSCVQRFMHVRGVVTQPSHTR